MFPNNSKFTRVCAIIAFSITSLMFTIIIAYGYYFDHKEIPVLGVVIIVLYDVFAIWFDIHYIGRKSKKSEDDSIKNISKSKKKLKLIGLVLFVILILTILYLNKGNISEINNSEQSLTCDPIEVIRERFNVDLTGKAQVIAYDYYIDGIDSGLFAAKLALDNQYVDSIIKKFDTQIEEHDCLLDDWSDIVSWWDLNQNKRVASYTDYESTDDLFGTDHKYMYTIYMEVFIAKDESNEYYMYVYIG